MDASSKASSTCVLTAIVLAIACMEPLPAQVTLRAVPVEDELTKKLEQEEKKKKTLEASLLTQKEARALTLTIPAPRGQIVDRNGIPFAQNRVANYLALVMPYMKDADDNEILVWAKSRIERANAILEKEWSVDDEDILSHYEHRRWLPLIFSSEKGLFVEINVEQQEKLVDLFKDGLALQPAYIRHYPKEDSACHIVGFTGKTRPLPTGPIVDGDPLFEEMAGREGLELTFDDDLRGQPGVINVLFSADGERLSEDTMSRPVQGNNVVTSLDFNYQKYCENALKKYAQRGGAMTIMDVRTGDILAMASNPGYDLNDFIPGVTSERYKELSENELEPLYPRSFRGQYPPASTFKIVTALGALQSGKVTDTTSFNCSTAMQIGDRVFHNWNKKGEGRLNVISAIKRSCNTWFYAAALETGADPITDMALRLGFGEKTGIPLKAEAAGFVPTNSWMVQSFGHKILSGQIANISIGQGRVLVSPLQVAQCMAGLADGVNMPKPRLVKQIQDYKDQVVSVTEPEVRQINLNPEHREIVVKGMVAVVSGGGGTGRAAGIKHAQVAGKTGTAQWKVKDDRNLAWFTGFVPANNPMFAFAVVYEGAPGQTVSGGRNAAPMISEVFNNIYSNAPSDDPIVLAMKDTPTSMEVDEGTTEPSEDELAQIRRAVPQAPPPPPPKKTLGGFFKKLFGR
jgi:penicillin-binding protein 2